MNVYADTSVLVSLYTQDANSARADEWRQRYRARLLFSPFHRVELRNALNLGVFRKRLSAAQIELTWKAIQVDVANGILTPIDINWDIVLEQAEKLATAFTPSVGSRTLDIIHVAGARVLGSEEFCTFDPRQAKVAELAGLKVIAV